MELEHFPQSKKSALEFIVAYSCGNIQLGILQALSGTKGKHFILLWKANTVLYYFLVCKASIVLPFILKDELHDQYSLDQVNFVSIFTMVD